LIGEVPAAPPGLSAEAQSQLQYLRAVALERDGKLDEALSALAQVPTSSPLYAKALYRMGVLEADPHRAGGAKAVQALARFEAVLALRDSAQEDLARVKSLALLGIGRLRYARGEYALASRAYEAVPRFSRFWGDALLENAFACFRRDDLGGALGSLESLHAPQFEGAFAPESWILKASVFYFSCLTEEAQAAVQAFEQLYRPVAQKLQAYTGPNAPQEPQRYLRAVESDSSELPRGLRQWVRHHEAVASALRLREQARAEAERAKREGLAEHVVRKAQEAEEGLTEVAAHHIKVRLEEARSELKRLSDQADVVRVETAKADKELVQAGVDQPALLASQRLYRPPVPQGSEYWQFDGEYWLDEIGSYQYTLKRGCPTRAEEKGPARR
jgi:hypothetical protein